MVFSSVTSLSTLPLPSSFTGWSEFQNRTTESRTRRKTPMLQLLPLWLRLQPHNHPVMVAVRLKRLSKCLRPQYRRFIELSANFKTFNFKKACFYLKRIHLNSFHLNTTRICQSHRKYLFVKKGFHFYSALS